MSISYHEIPFAEAKEYLIENWNDNFGSNFEVSNRDTITESEGQMYLALKAKLKDRLQLAFVAKDKEKIVGYVTGYQKDGEEFYMMNSAVDKAYRRRGIYSALMRYMVEKCRTLGFQSITSCHIMNNNAVLIPKLKFGFQIYSTEIDELWGALVKLKYYVNPVKNNLFSIRTGLHRPNKEMKKLLGI